MKLIIVESPHKAKTISKILGSGYTVKASLGHIRDLDARSLSVDLNTLIPEYKILPDKVKTVKELKYLAADAEIVIIASDPDREGEAIAWHLQQALNLKENYKRAEFHEITEKGVKEGLSHTRLIDKQLVSAQEARRVIDRLIGYGLSPYIMRNVSGARSAGRVQTAALRLIVERENKIKDFVPKDKYRVEVDLNQNGNKFTATVVRKNGDAKNTLDELDAQATAEKIKNYLTGKQAEIIEVKRSDVKKNPPPPFTTSTFQQACNAALDISPEDAMKIAQKLYEEGLITYMRTDSVRIADEALDMARNFLSKTFGAASFEKRIFKNKDGSQDAHEAIRPVSLSEPNLQGQDLAVYNLIKNRFVASLMPAAVYAQTDITIKIGELILTSSASVIKLKGYKSIYNDEDEEKISSLSGINQGRADVSGINIKEYQTKPPARFSESSIIKELENKGIGRPSTYANILKTLKAREYITVNKKNKQILPTDLGISALNYIIKDFSNLFSINYTAGMEKKLDEISAGGEKYGNVVKSLYSELKENNIIFANSFGASEKQVSLAEKLASEHNLELPKDYKTNGKACREFIDKAIKSNPFKPSEKQIALAESISQKNNVPPPKGYAEDAKVCSAFIDKYLKKSKGGKTGSKPPSEKQIAFAEKIAEKQGVELPNGYQKDWKICKEFIESNTNF